MQKKNIPIYCLVIFVIFWVWLAINPNDRFMWFVENVLLLIGLLILIFTYKKFRLSNLSYILIFIFAILVEIGAHYVYSLVPIDFLMTLFDWQRNNYDRIIHFAYGFLLAIPFSEVYQKTSKTNSGFWFFMIPILIALATGAIYEIIEWIFAVFAGANSAGQFLGMQGDIWDAQKDMFLAGLGAFITMLFYMEFKKNKL